ncbi:MAG: carboxypeptidase-like regulatory domain-containing protein [Planctomycetaceae bacterium]|nr:carboxypeptidase-like regulatory domain-containing protein [Planctomycetaceae bacterium]
MKKLLFAIVISLFVSGCGGQQRPDGFPKVFPVELTVTQEGKPLAGASVSLRSSETQWAIGGATDANGKVKLVTNGYPGAPTGKFKVIIVKTGGGEGTEERIRILTEGNGSEESIAAANRITVKFYSFVNPEYNEVDKTPLEVEITPSTKTLEVDAGPAVKIELKLPN